MTLFAYGIEIRADGAFGRIVGNGDAQGYHGTQHRVGMLALALDEANGPELFDSAIRS